VREDWKGEAELVAVEGTLWLTDDDRLEAPVRLSGVPQMVGMRIGVLPSDGAE
jgi:hypothetical protein